MKALVHLFKFAGHLVLSMALLAGVAGYGAPQSDKQATDVAKGWLRTTPRPLQASLSERVLRSVQTFRNQQADAMYHVISLEPEGFIIVSADTDLEPIIAFSATGRFEPDPENPLFHLVERDLPARLNQVQQQKRLKGNVPGPASGKWSRLLQANASEPQPQSSGISALDDLRVAPFIQSRWNQRTIWNGTNYVACYNYYTPPYAAGASSNYVCGCVSTAWAQIMRYFQYPTQPVGTAEYSIAVDGVITARRLRGGDGAGGPHKWSLMPVVPGTGTTEQERKAIGALTADIGLAAGTSYKAGGSSAWLSEATLKNVFHYSNAIWGPGWDTLRRDSLSANLDARLPVFLSISRTGGGHAVVCDGYGYNLSTLFHHLNLGWGGSADAWYNLPDIDTGAYYYTAIEGCLQNVFTYGSGEIISGRATDTKGAPIPSATVRAVAGAQTWTTLTDDKGIFAFSRVPSDTAFTLSVTKEGYLFPLRTVTSGRSQSYGSTGNKWGINVSAIAPPSVAFTWPLDNARLSNATVTATGTASGGLPIAQVQYQLNGVAWRLAQGTVSWQAQIGLIPRWNEVQVFSVDANGNRSQTNSLWVYYVVTNKLTLLTSGLGSMIRENFTGNILEVGKKYTVTAVPDIGYGLVDWTDGTGRVLTNAPTLTFTMQSNLVLVANFRDVQPPTITIASPLNNTRLTNPVVTVVGTANDNVVVVAVEFRVSNALWTNDWRPAGGTTDWTALASGFYLGTNLIRVRARDSQTNFSTRTEVAVVYSPRTDLTLITNGSGSIEPNLTNNNLFVGRTYTLTATPATGHIFYNWSGGVLPGPLSGISSKPQLTFTMQTGLCLQATFVVSPFMSTRGTYNGLFYETNEARLESSGALRLTVNKRGLYSGELVQGTNRVPVSGQLGLDGRATNSLASDSLSGTVEWILDLDGSQTNSLTGRVIAASGLWEAQVLGDLAPVYGTALSPYKGKYTLAIPGCRDASVTETPVGDGYGTLQVGDTGMATLSGTLADGTPITLSAQVSTNGILPLYLSLSDGKGSLLAWVQVNTNPPPAEALRADSALWVKPANANSLYYPAGFEVVTSLTGSKYKASKPVLPFIDGTLVFLGGNLAVPLTNQVTLTASNTVINRGPQPLIMTITKTNGVFSGTFVLPGTTTSLPFQGAILQGQTNGCGYFRNAGQSGWVIFGPAD